MTNISKTALSRAISDGQGKIPILGAHDPNDPNYSKAAGAFKQNTLAQELFDLGAYQPLHDIVIVQFQQAPDRSDGGVLLPDSAQRRPEEGVVVAAGPGNTTYTGTHVPVGVKRGDCVRFQPAAIGNPFRHPSVPKEVLLLEMRETDILGVWAPVLETGLEGRTRLRDFGERCDVSDTAEVYDTKLLRRAGIYPQPEAERQLLLLNKQNPGRFIIRPWPPENSMQTVDTPK